MIRFAILLSTLLLFSPLLSAQHSSNKKRANYNYNNSNYSTTQEESVELPPNPILSDKYIELEASLLMNIEADGYLAIFHLEQRGKNMTEVEQNLNSRIDKFKERLIELGISQEQIVVDIISLVPEYEYDVEKKLFSKTYNEIPVGFEMKKNVHVYYKDTHLISEIMKKATESEIYDIAKVEYFIENTEELYDSLRSKAFELIAKKEKHYQNADFGIDESKKVASEVRQTYFPPEQYVDYQAISVGDVSFSKNSRINRQNHAPSSFYQQIPYDNIELIINPNIVEPPVQLYFNLKVRYILKSEPKEIYILTEDGVLKKVNLGN